MAAVLCPRCGAAVPFTGAFAFVLCPNDQTVINIAHAARAPAGSEGRDEIRLPSAAALIPPEIELAPPIHIVRRLARAATLCGTVLVGFLLLAELVTLLLGAPQAWAFARATAGPIVPIFVSFPFPVLILGLGGAAAVVWHSLVVAVILVSFAVIFRGYARDAWAKFLRTIEGGGSPPLSEPNAFFAIARILSLAIFSGLAVEIIAAVVGGTPQEPPGLQGEPLGSQLILYAHAAVWEELITRVLLLGVPLLLIHYLGRGRLEGRWQRYLVGGGLPVDGAALAFVVFSAAVFGAMHIPSWDVWKFPSVFIGGLGLGVLFLRYGLPATILVHFLLDYEAPTIAFTGLSSLHLLVILLLPAVGVVQAIRYLFVVREALALGRVPEYLGGPPEASPAALRVAAAGPVAVSTPLGPPDATQGAGPPAPPPGGRG